MSLVSATDSTLTIRLPARDVLGPDLRNILRFNGLSYDYPKFIARSTCDSDLQRAKISLRSIVSLIANTVSDDPTIAIASESYLRKSLRSS